MEISRQLTDGADAIIPSNRRRLWSLMPAMLSRCHHRIVGQKLLDDEFLAPGR
ncbi:hypothetical protein JQK88_34390 [Mesorhizobium caraganae]|uniref:hypothetical protein n=1 Tax=Mesorhizobium caraganae TaxID=483206 RepID=UPI00193ADB41|nr:hypothetical protein [Mesorhizobium caraganae]MBM2716166.1 hypothetical protein [Mesorhizobium caraganae]